MPLSIILDTNVYFTDWKLESPSARAFLDYIEKTGSRIIVPQIVWDEIEVNYRKELEKKHANYEKASEDLVALLRFYPSSRLMTFFNTEYEIDVNDEVMNYKILLSEKIGIKGGSGVMPYGMGVFKAVTDRALNKKHPFNGVNDREYKDSLLWEMVLSAFRNKSNSNDFVFISNDGNAFTDSKKDRKVLRPELQAEIDKVKGERSFYFYRDLATFVENHYAIIRSVKPKDIWDHLERFDINDAIKMLAEELSEDIAFAVINQNPGAHFSNLTEDIQSSLTFINVSQLSFYITADHKGEKLTIFQKIGIVATVDIGYIAIGTKSFDIGVRTKKVYFGSLVAVEYDKDSFKDGFNIEMLYLKEGDYLSGINQPRIAPL
ncbi:PIN domain-containing protein [Hymenobacter tibetensis]|uniref:PIN domain-containing protein n=1 Tax=Hymenobacter tibetensis TaxID=497967 RepID=A0ABY4D9K5_9BACT|nr:PIN domain-containing protein [Hymenobacter tibetensis]UOG76763.1 PIN domain-containing protein [Hymenobacter tibetensis]